MTLASYEVYSDKERRYYRSILYTITEAKAAALIEEMQGFVVAYCQAQSPTFCA